MEKEKMPRNYRLYENIRKEKIYKSNIVVRDRTVRKLFENELDVKNTNSILPGQLIMFNYFEPATEKDLEYYDAMPVTIFFNKIKTDDGPRVLGFNIHYYPPRIRYQVMDRIFEIFKPFYSKAWNEPLKKELSYIEYKMLMEQLEKAKLNFGVRMYIPKLMDKITPIPSKYWSKAVFTEGRFKKRTREAIMNYWKNLKTKTSK